MSSVLLRALSAHAEKTEHNGKRQVSVPSRKGFKFNNSAIKMRDKKALVSRSFEGTNLRSAFEAANMAHARPPAAPSRHEAKQLLQLVLGGAGCDTVRINASQPWTEDAIFSAVIAEHTTEAISVKYEKTSAALASRPTTGNQPKQAKVQISKKDEIVTNVDYPHVSLTDLKESPRRKGNDFNFSKLSAEAISSLPVSALLSDPTAALINEGITSDDWSIINHIGSDNTLACFAIEPNAGEDTDINMAPVSAHAEANAKHIMFAKTLPASEPFPVPSFARPEAEPETMSEVLAIAPVTRHEGDGKEAWVPDKFGLGPKLKPGQNIQQPPFRGISINHNTDESPLELEIAAELTPHHRPLSPYRSPSTAGVIQRMPLESWRHITSPTLRNEATISSSPRKQSPRRSSLPSSPIQTDAGHNEPIGRTGQVSRPKGTRPSTAGGFSRASRKVSQAVSSVCDDSLERGALSETSTSRVRRAREIWMQIVGRDAALEVHQAPILGDTEKKWLKAYERPATTTTCSVPNPPSQAGEQPLRAPHAPGANPMRRPWRPAGASVDQHPRSVTQSPTKKRQSSIVPADADHASGLIGTATSIQRSGEAPPSQAYSTAANFPINSQTYEPRIIQSFQRFQTEVLGRLAKRKIAGRERDNHQADTHASDENLEDPEGQAVTVKDPPILPMPANNDWAESDLLLDALDDGDDVVPLQITQLFKAAASADANPQALQKLFFSSFSLLRTLHADLGCPQRLHEAFWSAHCQATPGNIVSVVLRLSTLNAARNVLLALLRTLFERPAPADLELGLQCSDPLAPKVKGSASRPVSRGTIGKPVSNHPNPASPILKGESDAPTVSTEFQPTSPQARPQSSTRLVQPSRTTLASKDKASALIRAEARKAIELAVSHRKDPADLRDASGKLYQKKDSTNEGSKENDQAQNSVLPIGQQAGSIPTPNTTTFALLTSNKTGKSNNYSANDSNSNSNSDFTLPQSKPYSRDPRADRGTMSGAMHGRVPDSSVSLGNDFNSFRYRNTTTATFTAHKNVTQEHIELTSNQIVAFGLFQKLLTLIPWKIDKFIFRTTNYLRKYESIKDCLEDLKSEVAALNTC